MPRIDRTKLCAWFAAQGPALVLFARQCLTGGDRESASDVVQEVFVRLLARTDDTGGIAEPPNPVAWLHRCVRNACLDERRSRRRRASRERRVAAERSEWFEPQPHDLIDTATARQLVESLDDAPRQILVLRIWSALTLTEIAEVVNLPTSTVHDHYRKALAKLRVAMESRRESHVRNPP